MIFRRFSIIQFLFLVFIVCSLFEKSKSENETVSTSIVHGDETYSPEGFSIIFDNFCCKCTFDRDAYEKLCMSSGVDSFSARLALSEVLTKVYNRTDMEFMTDGDILSSMIKSFRDQKWKISRLCCYPKIPNFPSEGCLTKTFYNHSTTEFNESSERNETCGSLDLNICNRHDLTYYKEPDSTSFYLTLISCFLLLLTILTYLLLPSLLNIHGKCILCHLIFLFLFFILQFVEQFYVNPDIFIKFSDRIFSSCWTVGFLMYTSSIAANLWLLAVNVDLFQTFTRKYIEDKEESRKRFRKYTVTVMSLTILMSLVVLVAELTITENSNFKPQIGCTRCFFPVTHGYSILMYYYGIIAAILCFDLIAFVWTNYILCVEQSQISRAKDQSLIKQGLERMFLFFKLFCVSGTTWTINVIFWIIREHEVPVDRKNEAARFFELFNVSHGFCYFIVFVCKPSIMKMYHKRFFARTIDSTSNSVTTNLSRSSSKRIRI